MSAAANLFIAPWRVLTRWLGGLRSLYQLLGLGLRSLRQGRSGLAGRLGDELSTPAGQRLVFSVLRSFVPNLVLSRVLVRAYDNSGTAIVTRREDVLDVLSRDDDFEVVYGPRMRKLTGGENFFLGMQPGWPYQRDVSSMRLAARQSDVEKTVHPRAAELAAKAVSEARGALDVPQELGLLVSSDLVGHYFGTPGPSAEKMVEWTTILFWYLFVDLAADADVEKRALAAAAELRSYLDQTVAARKSGPTHADDVLGRCLALQRCQTPGMDDLGIRNNLLGLVIGAVPTLSKAACLALDTLLDRPRELDGAQQAARSGDEALVAQYLWEALRFNPHNPIVYRRATRDAVIAPSTLRQRTIPKGSMVLAANLSAMFDPQSIPSPEQFRVDRPWSTYIHWGYGVHTCFGAHINRAVLPAILLPLLQQPGLRRAPGDEGQLDTGGTPFPQHLHVRFDAQ